MAIIRPCIDLKNNYNEISKICHETNEPIYITKNGENDLVILTDEAYKRLRIDYEDAKEKIINEIIAEEMDKKFSKPCDTFEEFKEYLIEKLESTVQECKKGKEIPMEKVIAEMEERYHFDE